MFYKNQFDLIFILGPKPSGYISCYDMKQGA